MNLFGRISLSIALAIMTAPQADACAVAASLDDGLAPSAPKPPAAIQSERVILDWDPSTRTEELIREIAFETNAKRFGFIVPTPTQAEAQDVSGNPLDAVERRLEKTRETKIRWARRHWTLWRILHIKQMLDDTGDGFSASPTRALDSPASLAPSDIVDIQSLADFVVYTVHTRNVPGFQEWLTQNGFQDEPFLQEWYRPYIEKGYYFSVFVYRPASGTIRTRWVKLTFKSDAPYYPYAEPQKKLPSSRNPDRLLRLYLISDRAYVPEATPGIQLRDRLESMTDERSRARRGQDLTRISRIPFHQPELAVDQQWIREASIPYSESGMGKKRWLTLFSDWGDHRPGIDPRFVPETNAPSLGVFPRTLQLTPPLEVVSWIDLALRLTVIYFIGRGIIRSIRERSWRKTLVRTTFGFPMILYFTLTLWSNFTQR